MTTSSAAAALVHVRRRPPPTPAPPDGSGRILTCACRRRYAGPAAAAARLCVMRRRPPPPAYASCCGGHRSHRRSEACAAAAATLVHVGGRPSPVTWCVERAPPIKGTRGGRRHTCARRRAAAVLVFVCGARIFGGIVGCSRPYTRPAAAAADASPARWRRAHSYVRLPPTKCKPGGRRRPLVRHAAAAAAARLCVMRRRPPRSPPIRGVRGGRRHTCTCRRAAAVLVFVRGVRIDGGNVGGSRPYTRPAAPAADASPARWRRAHLSVRLPPRIGTNGGRRRSLVGQAEATADHAHARRPPPHLYTSAGGRRPCHYAPSTD